MHRNKTKYIFVAFHFYFLLDLFQTALSFKALRFFYGVLMGFARRKINPAKMTIAPNPCIKVKFSPSNNPQITATTGINKVTVEANNGVEMLSNR